MEKRIEWHRDPRLESITLADCKRDPEGCRNCSNLGNDCKGGRMFRPAISNEGKTGCWNRE
jgi:hypothetical protein